MAVDIDLTKYRNEKLESYLRNKRMKIAASRAYRRPLSSPRCGDWTPDGLITRTFRWRSGRIEVVKAHAKVMVALLKALAIEPRLEVTASATSPYSGSYRSYSQQKFLRDAYLSGDGHLAADPCSGYHRTGRALDLEVIPGDPYRVHQEKVMESVRVDGKRFFHGDVFGDPPHYSFGELG